MAPKRRPNERNAATDGGWSWRRADFERAARDALAHLYDVVYLQTHPLAALALARAERPSAGAGQALRQALVEAIEALRPPTESIGAEAWRGYRDPDHASHRGHGRRRGPGGAVDQPQHLLSGVPAGGAGGALAAVDALGPARDSGARGRRPGRGQCARPRPTRAGASSGRARPPGRAGGAEDARRRPAQPAAPGHQLRRARARVGGGGRGAPCDPPADVDWRGRRAARPAWRSRSPPGRPSGSRTASGWSTWRRWPTPTWSPRPPPPCWACVGGRVSRCCRRWRGRSSSDTCWSCSTIAST